MAPNVTVAKAFADAVAHCSVNPPERNFIFLHRQDVISALLMSVVKILHMENAQHMIGLRLYQRTRTHYVRILPRHDR